MKKIFSFPSSFTKGFIDDDCYLWASALSYYTLLSIVPALAIVFGIAKGFGFEQALQTQIREIFYQQAQFAEKLITFANSTLENAHGTLIAGTGIILLFWSSIGLLGSFESALNNIWNIPVGRNFKEKITAYLPLLIFGPIFIIICSSSIYVMTTKIVEFSNDQGFYGSVKPLIHMSYYVLLIILSWFMFLFLYTYMPNRHIPWKSCLAASLFSGLALQLSQWAYIHLQVYLTSYNAIYGSFAAIPLFLLWLQIGWLITLAGAEFAKQHSDFGKNASMPISERGLFLLTILTCCKAYNNKQAPYTIETLATELAIPQSLAQTILTRFCSRGLLMPINFGIINPGYVPAMPADKIMLDEVLVMVDDQIDPIFHVNNSDERTQVLEALHEWDLEQKKLTANRSIKQLIHEKNFRS